MTEEIAFSSAAWIECVGGFTLNTELCTEEEKDKDNG